MIYDLVSIVTGAYVVGGCFAARKSPNRYMKKALGLLGSCKQISYDVYPVYRANSSFLFDQFDGLQQFLECI